LSAAPVAIGGLKTMIRSVDAAALSDFVELLCTSEQKSVRATLRAFAADRGVAL
jgi:signal transduction protein with GAF and PtsI domain